MRGEIIILINKDIKMNLNDEKLSYNYISKLLNDKLGEEHSYDQVFSSMCTPPSDIARKIASEYAEINLGDPGLFPESVKLEKEVLEEFAELLHAPNSWTGTITSGGSESNLIGCWAARNWARKYKGIKHGKILIPKSAHVSFEKASDILDIQTEWIPLTEKHQVDINAVQKSIDKNTIGIIGIAGTTGTGACDDIKALSNIAENHNLYLHIDAAHGGTIFPFLEDLGLSSPIFDFQNRGVKSISIDTHKMFRSLIPGGCVIFRTEDYPNTIIKNISYLSDSSTKQMTITGTRPGSSVIASWILLKKFGRSYMVGKVKKALENTKYLTQRLKENSMLELTFEPMINIVGFTNKVVPNVDLVKSLNKKGWHLSIYSNWIRIVVMPHVLKNMIDIFISDLQEQLKTEAE